MPVTPLVNYPGVYIQEGKSDVHTIAPVSTATTAFIGRALRGPVNEPKEINSFADFERIFGGLWKESKLGFAVDLFFSNGGRKAVIVRLCHNDPKGANNRGKPNVTTQEKGDFPQQLLKLPFIAKSPGAWGTQLNVEISLPVLKIKEDLKKMYGIDPDLLFNLKIKDIGTGVTEYFSDLTIMDAPRRVDKVLIKDSQLLAYDGSLEPNGASAGSTNPDNGSLQVISAAQAVKALQSIKAEIENVLAPETAKSALEEAKKQIENALQAADPEIAQKLKTIEDDEKEVVEWIEKQKENVLVVKTPPALEEEVEPEVKKPLEAAQDKIAKVVVNAMDEENTKARLAAQARIAKALEGAKAAVILATATAQATSQPGTPPSNDGGELDEMDVIGDANLHTGIYALDNPKITFNLFYIPPYKKGDVHESVLDKAAKFCYDHRAFLLVDALAGWTDKDKAIDGFPIKGLSSNNAAIYFPRIKVPNRLSDNQVEEFGPGSAIAGIYANTDATRGVWKAPAGLEATLKGVVDLTVNLNDAEIGELNPLGINCLRQMPAAGFVVWGARTIVGDDRLTSEWKYIPVRRTALMIEESLYRGSQWAVFEPNDEPLWSQLRLNIGAFMHDLFRQGAFQGGSPQEAYFVKCDKTTTTQSDIDRGIVNIMVGFAPLKPAEFVILYIQQKAGELAA